jgi:uncharacterized membrane protein
MILFYSKLFLDGLIHSHYVDAWVSLFELAVFFLRRRQAVMRVANGHACPTFGYSKL